METKTLYFIFCGMTVGIKVKVISAYIIEWDPRRGQIEFVLLGTGEIVLALVWTMLHIQNAE